MITDDIESFIEEWNDAGDRLLVHTSGSTGVPKPFWAQKEKMANSARLTCDFLGLKSGDTALLCMPMRYIAGKMVVVRSLIRQLRLVAVEPCGHPLANVEEHLVFAAMTPMQVYNTLQVDVERKRLMDVENLIIGGGAIDPDMMLQLSSFPNKVYSTYGMTETLSHIAMRRLNGDDASQWYKPMDNVTVSLATDGVLAIDAPLVAEGLLVTNDIAEVREDGCFRIIGRRDNIINSGGVKIQIEEVETLLLPHIKGDFAITSMPDKKFGEIVVLLVSEMNADEALEACKAVLPRLWIPKLVKLVESIPHTGTGKIDRATCKALLT